MCPAIINWLIQNVTGILGVVVSGFIAYHVYFLSQRIGLTDKLVHKDNIRKQAEQILRNISKGIRSDTELINVKKYLTHYPHNNDKDKHGYTYLKGGLKALRFDGVELSCGWRETYQASDGTLHLRNVPDSVRTSFNVLEVGVIPYEWIEYIDPAGDEFSYRPQFFTNFLGPNKSPYKYLTYYVESDVYHEGSDPVDMKWRHVEIQE